ncbi:MAG: glycosyltransferase family 4 protein [Planctomycetes bacterium]|nr:glycosyltransferase family 4 protein [Planctomycetota bacterium]
MPPRGTELDERALERPEVLIVAPSHGYPPTQARLARPLELASELSRRGASVDIVLLLERPLQPYEEDGLEELRAAARDLDLVRHPAAGGLLGHALVRLREALPPAPKLGGWLSCPPKLLALLRARHAPRGYRAVIACGVELARALEVFPRWTERLLDIPRIGRDAHESHARAGRPDAFEAFAGGERELALLGGADALLVRCTADAVRLRQIGFQGDLCSAPIVARGAAALEAAPRAEPVEPIRPPRILCVGSETTANLDGIRWFRRQVFPAIARRAPTCRLRLVGEVSRHIEPGPGVDRIGWVERLDEEYRDAAIVALPLRMGSGLRRRLVEALGCGKAVAATTVGAHGSGLVPQEDAVIADGAAAFAEEIGRALTSDVLRKVYEKRALAAARTAFSPEQALAALAERLDLDARERSAAPRPEAALITA